jgi:hypothetical protein
LARTLRTCGELGASLVTEMVSLRGPEDNGAKVMETVQAALGATMALAHEAMLLEKSAGLLPPAEMLEMCSGALLGLLIVTLVGTLARPWVTGEKLTEAGAKRRTGPELLEARPVPVRLMECGLLLALSVNVRVA